MTEEEHINHLLYGSFHDCNYAIRAETNQALLRKALRIAWELRLMAREEKLKKRLNVLCDSPYRYPQHRRPRA